MSTPAAGRTAWFHCFAGSAGDMTMASLIHAGASLTDVAAIVSGLPLDGYVLSAEPVLRCGVASTHVLVAVHDEHAHDDPAHDHPTHDHAPHRPYREVRALIEAADLPERVRQRALATFAVLAEVEGQMHRTSPDDVEFHEVGSVDAIVDVVGTCAALEVLGIDRIVCSPIAVGHGTVRAAHGVLPNPAPAVVELLARRQAPSRGIDDHRELATPTGVALMAALADTFGPMPAMSVESIGYGAGTADIPGRPNVVQVVVGTEAARTGATGNDGAGQPVQSFEANVDDVSGEVLAHAIAALLAAGAHDAWATPIVMKKGRPAHTVHALCDPARAAEVAAVLVRETGSLGVRGSLIERWPQQRSQRTIDVHGHPVRIKYAEATIKVEHDDALAVAAATGLPLRTVLAEAGAIAAREL
ncbi:MAG: nickel pincer cofactor biosynthesis protein LarC [Ilumatobacteraceae bacterium]